MNTALIPTLTTRHLPRLNKRVRDVSLVIAASLFVAAMAQVRIPLPFTPVPFTGQTFAVLLVGATLGAPRAAASMALYLLMGISGLPFFAGGASGLVYLTGPTGGYLVGFISAAYVVGLMAEGGMDRRFRFALLVFLIGEAIIYGFGLIWLSHFTGLRHVLSAGLIPFVPGDILKLLAAALLLPTAWKYVR